MKKIVAVNASPRKGWNTDALVREAARGAQTAGAQIQIYDLYRLGRYSGCVSCFGCKLPEHRGICALKDGLSPVLDEIQDADGLILGSPNYLGNVTAGFRALYERLVFQTLTYQKERMSYSDTRIPVLFIMTSNASEEYYPQIGYDKMMDDYRNTLNRMVGPTKLLVCGNTLQVTDYEKYDWTMFDPEEKKAHHEATFPSYMQMAHDLGVEMVGGQWR